MDSSFNGPLFIVGLPRSGTKLIRDLLNQNPRIAIPESETHFIPYWTEKFGQHPGFNEANAFDDFFNEFKQTPFYQNMSARGREMTAEHLRNQADLTNWSSILETILRFYAPSHKTEQRRGQDFIWGDKTPGYVTHMNLLTKMFDSARFLHIIRDPRDYALSVNNAWGKHLYLAADVWQRSLTQARHVSRQFEERYLEIFYEDLIKEPRATLTRICAFLGVEFVPAMLALETPSENLGDTRGRTDIVQDNSGKFIDKLTPEQIKRIEEIVWPVLIDNTPYEPHIGRQHLPLRSINRRLFHFKDGIASAHFHIREKGLFNGLSYFYRLHVRSSWR